mmetsp:Transcript_18194/g.57162  ORF Transcript_18194/g.57162 Transcript_18194/m.57162 type:complete len:243 (+) Transcript_18194:534-1262(+)
MGDGISERGYLSAEIGGLVKKSGGFSCLARNLSRSGTKSESGDTTRDSSERREGHKGGERAKTPRRGAAARRGGARAGMGVSLSSGRIGSDRVRSGRAGSGGSEVQGPGVEEVSILVDVVEGFGLARVWVMSRGAEEGGGLEVAEARAIGVAAGGVEDGVFVGGGGGLVGELEGVEDVLVVVRVGVVDRAGSVRRREGVGDPAPEGLAARGGPARGGAVVLARVVVVLEPGRGASQREERVE